MQSWHAILFLLLTVLGATSSSGQSFSGASNEVQGLIQSCASEAAAAYRRCATACGASGVRSFSPGTCGVGATCLCGSDSGGALPPWEIEQ